MRIKEMIYRYWFHSLLIAVLYTAALRGGVQETRSWLQVAAASLLLMAVLDSICNEGRIRRWCRTQLGLRKAN